MEEVARTRESVHAAAQRAHLETLVPQHGYNQELEADGNIFASHFATLTDQDWLALLKRSLRERVIDGVEFPRFPEEALQERIHGNVGEETLDEAFGFYQFCRDNTYGTAGTDGKLRFLDFGAGWGRMTRPFLRDFPAGGLYGYEPNQLFCWVARALNPYVCYLHGGNVPSESLPRNWFDVLVGYSVFSHLPQWLASAWLGEINSSLRQGGWCVLTTWGRRFLERLQHEKARMESGEPIHWYSQRVLAGAGDLDTCMRRYDDGEFLLLDEGEGNETWGTAFLSEPALRRMLAEESLDFELLRFDTSTLAQDAFILRRPGL